MKPKDKAKQLYELIRYDVTTLKGTEALINEVAKRCAIMTINEMIDFEKIIINQLHKITKNAGGEFKVENEFWIQVKEEIEKL